MYDEFDFLNPVGGGTWTSAQLTAYTTAAPSSVATWRVGLRAYTTDAGLFIWDGGQWDAVGAYSPSSFPAAGALTGSEGVAVVQGGVNVLSSASAIAGLNNAAISAIQAQLIPVIQSYANLVANYSPVTYQSYEVITTDLGVVYSDGTKWIPVGAFQSAGSGGNNGLFNFTAQNTINLRAAIARVAAGTGNCRLACIGDSTTLGAYASGVIYTGNKPLAYPAQLAKQLVAKNGIPATNDSWFGSGNITGAAAGYTAYNPAVTFPVAGFAPGSIQGLGAYAMACTTNGGTISFTPAEAFDTIDVYYLNGTGGSFSINVDGGAALATVSTVGAHTVMLKTVSCTLGTHTINVVAGSATANFMCGMAVRASATPQVEVYNMGWSAVVVLNAAAPTDSYAEPTSGTYPYCYFIALPVVAPHATIINLTINDINNQTETVSGYQAALQTMITAALALGDCILMIGNPGNTSAWTGGIIAPEYQAAVYALAVSNNIPLIDLTLRWTSYAVTNPIMPYGDAGAAALHPSQVGYADMAGAVRSLFS